MPNTKAAKKDLRQTKKRTVKNSTEKRAIKELLKKALRAVEAGKAEEVQKLIKDFQKKVDKAVKAGWLKKNTANRKKSRLASQVKKISKK